MMSYSFSLYKRKRYVEPHTILIILSPTLDQEFASISTTLVNQIFSKVSKLTNQCNTAYEVIKQLKDLAYIQFYQKIPPPREERVIVITEFKLFDMTCFEFLQRVKQIRSPPGYIHVAVVDPDFKRTRQFRCNQGGGHYYKKPMDTFAIELFKLDILRREAPRQDAQRFVEFQRREAARVESRLFLFERQRLEALRIEEAQGSQEEKEFFGFKEETQEALTTEEAPREETQRQEALGNEEAQTQEALTTEEAQR